MVERIASFVTNTNINRNTMRLQAEFSKLTQQAASGLKSETYSGIARDTQYLLKLEADLAASKRMAADLTTVTTRIETMFDALNGMTDEIAGTIANVSAAISGGQLSPDEMASRAQATYDSLAAALNTRIGDRYVFGGSTTTIAPVDVNDAAYPIFTTPSAPNTAYYQGNHDAQIVRAANGFDVDYSLHADQAGFEKSLRALNLIINNPGDNATLTEALGLLQEANDEIGVMAHRVSLNAGTMENQLAARNATNTHLTNTISDLRGVNVADATLRSKEIEAQLTASFSLTATLLSLRIVDYLR